MISFRNELDIRKWPNKGIYLISVIAAVAVTFIDGLNHIRCLVLDLKLLKKGGGNFILFCLMYFLAFPFVFVFFHVLFVLYICSMVSWTHLVFKFAGYCLFNIMSVSFSHCNVTVQIISFNLTLISIKEFCGFPFQFPFFFYLYFSLYNSYFLFILFFKRSFLLELCCSEL